MPRQKTHGSILLRDWRRERGLTQAQACVELGMDHSALSALECGRRRPGIEVAFRIQDVAGVPAESWLELAEEDEDESHLMAAAG